MSRLNLTTVNVVLLMVNTVVRVFLTESSDEEMSEMSCDEHPVRMRQTKKTWGEKGGGKLRTTTTNNYN